MNIEIEKWIIKEKEIICNVAHKIVAVTKCCEDILDEDYLDLTSKDDYGNYIGYGVKLVRTDTYDEDYYYKDIKYCPFCGKPINIIVDDTIDYTDSYNKLKEQQGELYKKLNRSDSVKSRKTIYTEIEEINKRISYMYKDDGIEILSDLVKGSVK